jgi:integrase
MIRCPRAIAAAPEHRTISSDVTRRRAERSSQASYRRANEGGPNHLQCGVGYLQRSVEEQKRADRYEYKRVLEQPKLGTKKLADISDDEITGIIHPLAHSEKRNTLAVGRTFFRWCVGPPRSYLKHSPLEGVEIPKAGKRKRILNEEELIAVWHATVRQGYQLMPKGKRAQAQTEIRNGRMPTSSAPRRQAGSLGHRWRQANVVADHCAES